MAEDEDGASNKNSSQNTNNEALSEDSEQNYPKPDLGIEEAKYNSSESDEKSAGEAATSSAKSSGAVRKEENPFSFRHFLKRDLSLPSNSTYECTGARPKVYANTVQHSPNKIDISEPRRDKARSADPQTKENSNECPVHLSDNTTANSSVEIPFSLVDNSESKHNLFVDNTESPYYYKSNVAPEPLGMPSLPDFVQDHIIVEQAYLNSNGPISVDLENLPDFTFNTNYNSGSSSSLGRRHNSGYGGNRNYDYEPYSDASTSDTVPPGHGVPLDLPEEAEAGAAVPLPLDLPPHLNLDLTESVNPADRRNNSPRNTFPLDLPPNAGAESMRLPDFLPVHPGRTSPEPEHHDNQLAQIIAELDRTRSELFSERSRRSRLESELATARASSEVLRSELASARRAESAARARLGEAALGEAQYAGRLDAAASRVEANLMDTACRATEAESTVCRLKNQIKKLKAELSTSQAEVQSLRGQQSTASRDLRQATALAETSLMELLSGLEQLRTISSTLDPT